MEMKTLSLLLIEDDEIEHLKFKRVCSKSDHNPKIAEAKNGEEALAKLQEGIPNVILLDLNMPKMNGIEFLKVLKTDDRLKYIPIIVMSSSNNYNDIKKCYEIGIAGYLTKPLRYEDYSKNIHTLLDYWSVNELISQ